MALHGKRKERRTLKMSEQRRKRKDQRKKGWRTWTWRLRWEKITTKSEGEGPWERRH
jgi:ribosomal protein L21